jgi:hypothetical protein
MDLWNPAVGNCIKLQSRDTGAIPVKGAMHNNRCSTYVPNTVTKRDLQIPTVKQEARKYNTNFQKRLDAHPNNLANALFQKQLGTRRLKADSHIACRAHAVPLSCRASKGLECVFPI